MTTLIPERITKTLTNAYEYIFPGNNRLRKLQLKNKMLAMKLDGRTSLDDVRFNSGSEPSIKIPRTPYNYGSIKEVYHLNSTIKRCVMAIRQEAFRNGYSFEPLFNYKCMECGREYDYTPDDEVCECGGVLQEPDETQVREAENFFKAVNENNQTLIQVLKEVEDDINIFDDGWIIARQQYEYDELGDIKSRRVKEFVRGSPLFMRFVADDKGRPGRKWGVCLKHRDEAFNWEDKVCPICGRKLHNVVAVGIERGGRYSNSRTYYIDGEVIHASKYSPSMTYGYSPISTLWDTSVALVKMTEYIYANYNMKRIPSGVISVATRNIESMQANWAAELEKLKKDRHHIPIIGVDPESGTNRMEFVKFMDSIADMQFRDVRDEFKKEIGALYGVEPFFLNDVSVGGGLNNEGLQLTVTNRTVEAAQEVYNNIINPALIKLIGVTDYKLVLEPGEEKDAAHDLDLEFKRIQNAQGMALLGFDVELSNGGEFVYEKVGQPTVGTEDVDSSEELDFAGTNEMLKDDVRINKSIWDNAIEALGYTELTRDYSTLSPDKSQLVNKILKTGFLKGQANYNKRDIIKQIMSKTGLEKYEAERIFRTEEQNLVNKAREIYYDKQDVEGEYKYKWVGPADNRTTDICKNITLRSRRGVPLKKLKEIIKEESSKAGGKMLPGNDYTPHVNCRHKFVRLVE